MAVTVNGLARCDPVQGDFVPTGHELVYLYLLSGPIREVEIQREPGGKIDLGDCHVVLGMEEHCHLVERHRGGEIAHVRLGQLEVGWLPTLLMP
jgi:hypothetical protein